MKLRKCTRCKNVEGRYRVACSVCGMFHVMDGINTSFAFAVDEHGKVRPAENARSAKPVYITK